MQNNQTSLKIDEESLKQLGKISVDLKRGKDIADIDIEPYNDKVIVQIAKIFESSIIELQRDTIESELTKQPKGVIRAIGPAAFYENKKNNEKHPEVGDIIYFATYSGRLHKDKNNGNEYRIILDTDVHFGEKS